MKLLRRIKLLALAFALSVIIWSSLCMTASAKKCLLICLFDPVYECRVVCF
jgi:hypothetical protein